MESRALSLIFLVTFLSYLEAENTLPCKTEECVCFLIEVTKELNWQCFSELVESPITDDNLLKKGSTLSNPTLNITTLDRKEITFKPLMIIRMNSAVSISCAHYKGLIKTIVGASIYDTMPNLNLENESIIHFLDCPLPKIPFVSFLKIPRVFLFSLEGNSLSPFDDLSLNTSIEFLENTRLTELHTDLFRGMTKLEKLYLSNNSITNIKPEVFQNLTNLKKLDLDQNEISELDPSIFQTLKSLQELNINDNNLVSLTSDLFSKNSNLKTLDISRNNLTTLPSGIFDSLGKLQEFQASENRFETFPKDLFSKNLKLQKVSFNHNKASMELPSGLFSNLPDLAKVSLIESGIVEIPSNIFWNSTSLNTISITGSKTLSSIPRELFRDCIHLSKLEIHENGIKDLPEKTFEFLKNLEVLNLSNNQLEKLTKDMLIGLQNLKTLDLSKNKLKYINTNAFVELGLLESLDLSSNLLDKCPEFYFFKRLENLNLSHNQISKIDTHYFTLAIKSLRELDLKWNNITSINITTLYSYEGSLQLDLSNNQITIVDMQQLENEVPIRKRPTNEILRVLLFNNPIACNYSNYDLLRYIARDMSKSLYETLEIKTENVRCNGNGVAIDSVDPEDFIIGIDECPASCHCNFSPYFTQITVKCSAAGLNEMPRSFPISYNGQKASRVQLILSDNSIRQVLNDPLECYGLVTELDLSGNGITKVDAILTHLPRLKILNLSKNQIHSISDNFVNSVASSKYLQKLFLSGNPFRCDCNDTPRLARFREHQHNKTLIDSDNISCNGKPIPLHLMTEEDYCPSLINFVVNKFMPVCGIIGLFSFILILFYLKYQLEIKVWMFSHRILLCWLTEEDFDSDKTYDAFVSFTHEDEEFVLESLIPELEKNFKICHHVRDFMPGEWIHNQILESVAKSRRTIIVLSENFLNSAWGLLEFRAAHMQALRDNCARVIILIYGEMPSEDAMDDEMKAYMKMNTYIKWNDAWFWEKLKYALPHAPSRPINDISMTHTNSTRTSHADHG